MALATTTLSSAVALLDKQIVVASATSVAAGRLVRIDDEVMQVTKDYVSGTTVTVLRGLDGTRQTAHVTTANVVHGLASDFALAGAQTSGTYPTQRPVLIQSITATSTLTLPPAGCDLRVILNGTAAITLTVPVPTTDMDGCQLTILSNGVGVHVPTFTGGLGGVGAGYTALTAAVAARGVNIVVYAVNGAWNVISAPGWTGTVTKVTLGVA